MKTVGRFLSLSWTLLMYTAFFCARPSFRALPSNIALSPSFLEQAVLMADGIEDPPAVLAWLALPLCHRMPLNCIRLHLEPRNATVVCCKLAVTHVEPLSGPSAH